MSRGDRPTQRTYPTIPAAIAIVICFASVAQAGITDCNSNGVDDATDIARGTSQDSNTNGIPDECEIIAAKLDSKPGSCPNSFNRLGRSVLPISLLGAPDFKVENVDLNSLRLARADGVGQSVAPDEGPPGPHTTIVDIATPFEGQSCDCHHAGPDGSPDLNMNFRTDELLAAMELNSLASGVFLELKLTGRLLDGRSFAGTDCVRLVPPGAPPGLVKVRADAPGAWIAATPLDLQLDGGGFGKFERTWPQGTITSLSADETHDGKRFVGWRQDGSFESSALNFDVPIIDDVTTIDAVFRLSGDMDSDGHVNLLDFAYFAACFGRTSANADSYCTMESLATADLNRDGEIDLADFGIFADSFEHDRQ